GHERLKPGQLTDGAVPVVLVDAGAQVAHDRQARAELVPLRLLGGSPRVRGRHFLASCDQLTCASSRGSEDYASNLAGGTSSDSTLYCCHFGISPALCAHF